VTVLASTMTDVLLRRVRDPLGFAHTREFARTCLSHAQIVLNAAIGVVVSNTTLTTNPSQMVYSVSGFLPLAARVIAVRENGRDLAKLKSHLDLAHLSLFWFREVASRFEAWCPVGRDLIVIYPAKPSVSSVEVRYAVVTATLAGEADALEMPEEYTDYILSLAECFLLLKQRDFGAAQAALTRVVKDMGIDMTAIRLHVAGAASDMVSTGGMRAPDGHGG
jgi:hypothetical protein